jgi:DNA-binding response OmpR family regulator
MMYDTHLHDLGTCQNPTSQVSTMSRLREKTVLVVEDDSNTADLVALYLQREGFQALTANDGEKGIALAERYRPDLVILDLMLPKVDGWEVCRKLRQISDVPVIMLTARDEEIDRVAGLTMGADDYVVKPFSPRELVARVIAVLRRVQPVNEPSGKVLHHGDIFLDLEKRILYVRDRAVDLTHHEYKLLEALMRTPGKAFTRDELLDYIYPTGEALVIDRVVDVHVGKLRKKIESNPSEPNYILTVRGIGYRFVEKKPFSHGTSK